MNAGKRATGEIGGSRLGWVSSIAILVTAGACAEGVRVARPAPNSMPMGSDAGPSLIESTGDAGSVQLAADASSILPPEMGWEPCAADARWVYLLGLHRELIRFEPDTMTFTEITTLTCEGDPEIHNMTVDRSGKLWVIDQSGNLSHVRADNGDCTETDFEVSQGQFEFRGMAFVGGQLFVAGANGALGTIDTTTLDLAVHAGGIGEAVSLTGTGDGKLWGLSSSRVVLVDQLVGQIVEQHEVQQAGAFQSAFAFWGGRFYIFLPSQSGGVLPEDLPSDGSTTVWVWTPGEGPATQLLELETRIVGAGVSTCAPFLLI